ncbi:DUF5673 domain-containing protein [Anaerococcus sp. DFU013_CI05]|uniref:DUF5673 domain-containing protein n=1 Tax=Anaerococcus sp. AH8042_DFU013_CI05 TaxID=3385202 RepID=UPI003A5224B2
MFKGKNNLDNFVLIMYIAIIAFFIYRIYKSFKNKKLLAGEINKFDRPSTTFEWVLLAFLLATGVFNLIAGIKQNNQNAIYMSVVMVVLAIVFLVAQQNKLYVAENGILINSTFYTYKELKKWGFDKEKNDFVMAVKKDRQDTSEATKVKSEDIKPLNDLIRKYKLGK